MKYTNIFNDKDLQNLPKLGFLDHAARSFVNYVHM
jgi:hypothetical protein